MRRDFSAFGDSRDAVLETAAGPRYTGKDYDAEAGLYYFNARWYDAELGRFTTEDPIKDGTNWYAYVNNGPLNATDPTGMERSHYSLAEIWRSFDSQLVRLEEKKMDLEILIQKNQLNIDKLKGQIHKEELNYYEALGQHILETIDSFNAKRLTGLDPQKIGEYTATRKEVPKLADVIDSQLDNIPELIKEKMERDAEKRELAGVKVEIHLIKKILESL